MGNLKIIETRAVIQGTKNFGAHTGRSLSNVTDASTTRVNVTVPEGYRFLGNVNLVVNGVPGIEAIFDGSNLNAATSLNPYLFNASTQNYTGPYNLDFHVYSLVISI